MVFIVSLKSLFSSRDALCGKNDKEFLKRFSFLWGKIYKLPVLSLRFFNVYGPRSRTSGTYGAVFGTFLAQKLAGRPFTVVGDGKQTRDFTYVKDVVRALQLAMKSDYHGILNVGTGKAYTFNQTVEILNKNMGLALKPQHVPNPIKNYVQHTLSDTAKAEKVLGFKARYNLEEGVKELLRFYVK